MIFIIFLNILATLFSLSYNTKITGANLIAPAIKKIQTEAKGLYFFYLSLYDKPLVTIYLPHIHHHANQQDQVAKHIHANVVKIHMPEFSVR